MELNELKIGVASGLSKAVDVIILFCPLTSLMTPRRSAVIGAVFSLEGHGCRHVAGRLVVLQWPVPEPAGGPSSAGCLLWDAKEAGIHRCRRRTLGGDISQSSEALAASAYTTDSIQLQPAGLILGGLRQKYSWGKWTKNSPPLHSITIHFLWW